MVSAGVVSFMAANAVAQNLYVTQTGVSLPPQVGQGGTVIAIQPNGTVSAPIISGLEDPFALAFDSSGDLFIGAEARIIEITPGGTQSTFASGMATTALAFNSAGDLFAGVGNTIIEITPNGTKSTFATLGFQQDVKALAFNSSGDLFAAESAVSMGAIFEYTPGGTQSTFATSINVPNALAFNSAGNLFVSSGGGSIFEFTPDGTRSTFATGSNGAEGLAFNSAGILFEASRLNGTIYEYTPGGTQSVFASGLTSPDALAFQPVPEPSVPGLVGAGTVSLLAWRFRRKRQLQCLGK